LNIQAYMLCIALALPLEHTLCDGGDSRIVPRLDGFENLGEALIVVLDLRWPGDVIGICVVPVCAWG
jgi:hypothetical protein